ncbi:X-linked retinitis pigmentosa GTPase regulator-interacting protein 1 [Quaeritorhiza haematococci]|nr:X-linked retinitis pigmentosa GTPase regulator-interacting protein 1 [Quaeritorhiza haematococci]
MLNQDGNDADQSADETTEEHPEESEDQLTLEIHRLQFDMTSPDVREVLEDTFQVFVSYDFLEVPPAELETQTVRMNDSGLIQFGFRKGFPLDKATHQRARTVLKRMLTTTEEEDAVIVFSIVSEPVPSTDNEEEGYEEGPHECVDIATAQLDLRQVLSNPDRCKISLTMWDATLELRMGSIVVGLEGVDCIRRVLKGMDNT